VTLAEGHCLILEIRLPRVVHFGVEIETLMEMHEILVVGRRRICLKLKTVIFEFKKFLRASEIEKDLRKALPFRVKKFKNKNPLKE